MIVVGAGVIGVEYASMFGALGTKVTVVDKRDRVLSFLDGEIGEAFQYLLRRQNVTFRLREQVAGVELDGDARGARVRLESGKGSWPRPCSTRSAARATPSTSGSTRPGLEADKRGRIPVDEDHRTAVPHIFAVGDVAGRRPGRDRDGAGPDRRRCTPSTSRCRRCPSWSRPASTRSRRSPWSAAPRRS